jgi:hypothetical protein
MVVAGQVGGAVEGVGAGDGGFGSSAVGGGFADEVIFLSQREKSFKLG